MPVIRPLADKFTADTYDATIGKLRELQRKYSPAERTAPVDAAAYITDRAPYGNPIPIEAKNSVAMRTA